MTECLLCTVTEADAFFDRERVWQDELWRLSVVRRGAVAGFAHLEPHRHIPFLTDLDGPEAATLGAVLARVASAMRDATDAEKIYVYVFGDRVSHLHFNLVPRRSGDALVGGAGMLRADAPEVDRETHERTVVALRTALSSV